MKCLLAILLVMPASAWAQSATAPVAQPVSAEQAAGPQATPPSSPATWAQNVTVPVTQLAVVDQAQSPQAVPPPPPPPDTHRRPSMVGYIDDGSIGSQVRIRYDAGYGITDPDRAEFFYGKCGCYRALPSSNAAFDPNAAGPGPGVVTNLNFAQAYLFAEYAPSRRFSLFGEVPFRFLRPDTFAAGSGSFPSANGLSDVHVGVKGGLVSTEKRELTVSLQAGFASGDASKGLGTGHGTIEPTLIYRETPSDRFALEAQFGDVIPTGGSAGVPTSSDQKFSGSVLYYGVGPSYAVYRTPKLAVAPVVEVVGWHVLSGFETAGPTDASGINIVNLKIGLRLLFHDRSSIYLGYGRALTDATWYNDIVRFEYRVALGR